jgi:hypothetical protein
MKGYRTLAFNAALALFGVAQAFDWTSVLGSAQAGYVVSAIGVVGMVLRALTTTPVGKSA